MAWFKYKHVLTKRQEGGDPYLLAVWYVIERVMLMKLKFLDIIFIIGVIFMAIPIYMIDWQFGMVLTGLSLIFLSIRANEKGG